MSIRLTIWLVAMAVAALLLGAAGLLAGMVGSQVVAGIIVLLVFAPCGWLLAWLAYRPVRGVTRTARSITSTGELDRRCFYPGPRDDVGELVVVINELLVRYDAAIGRLRRLQSADAACTCRRVATPSDPADLVVVELAPGGRGGPEGGQERGGRPEPGA